MTIYLQYLPQCQQPPNPFRNSKSLSAGAFVILGTPPTATMDPMFQPAFLLFQQKKQQGFHEMKVMFFFGGVDILPS